jgi:hypothetical protein
VLSDAVGHGRLRSATNRYRQWLIPSWRPLRASSRRSALPQTPIMCELLCTASPAVSGIPAYPVSKPPAMIDSVT